MTDLITNPVYNFVPGNILYEQTKQTRQIDVNQTHSKIDIVETTASFILLGVILIGVLLYSKLENKTRY